VKSQEKAKAFALRLPPDLRQWVEAQAVRMDRSLNWVVSRAVEQAKLQERKESQR